MWNYVFIILIVIILFLVFGIIHKNVIEEGFDSSDLLNQLIQIKQNIKTDLTSMNANVYQNGQLINFSNLGMNVYNNNGTYNQSLPMTNPSTLSFSYYSQLYMNYNQYAQQQKLKNISMPPFQDISGISLTVYVHSNIENIPSYINSINALRNIINIINQKGATPFISQNLINSINAMPKLGTIFDNSFCLQKNYIQSVFQSYLYVDPSASQPIMKNDIINMLRYSSTNVGNDPSGNYQDFVNFGTVNALGLMCVFYTNYLLTYYNTNNKTYYDNDVMIFNSSQTQNLTFINLCISFINNISIPYYQSNQIVSFQSFDNILNQFGPSDAFLQDTNGLTPFLNRMIP